MEGVVTEIVLLFSLLIIAAMYSSVGHGGASGYLAVLSLTAYAANDPVWLKQHAWSLNLLVAGIAFYAYKKSDFFDIKLALPFIVASIPAAFIGGYLQVDDTVYDILLSLTLVFAAWKLYSAKISHSSSKVRKNPPVSIAIIVGFVIGFLSGIIGVGGGIFLSPIILLFGWSDPKTTAGIAAVFIWVNSFSGLVGSALSGQLVIDVSTLIPFSVAVLIGGYIGSKYGSEKLSQNSIRNMLVAVMLIAAIRQILDLLGFMS
ncbi:MAG: sulfite exporter TauE/SafE family protein [Candidatus Poseidoniaceae archaeon]